MRGKRKTQTQNNTTVQAHSAMPRHVLQIHSVIDSIAWDAWVHNGMSCSLFFFCEASARLSSLACSQLRPLTSPPLAAFPPRSESTLRAEVKKPPTLPLHQLALCTFLFCAPKKIRNVSGRTQNSPRFGDIVALPPMSDAAGPF